MPTIRKDIVTLATAAQAWDAVRDVGALHTRLVPGFVTNTKIEPGARVVTFANGIIVRELIVSLDEARQRLVWTAESKLTTHYNSSAEVISDEQGRTHVIWTSDFLPNEAGPQLDAMMSAGARAMQQALDQLAG